MDFLDFELNLGSDADVELDADVDASAGGGVWAGLFEFVHLGSLPLMVVLSGLVLCAWSFAMTANFYLNASHSGFWGWGSHLR